MKKVFLVTSLLLGLCTGAYSQTSIATAKAQGVGASITVTGYVTNGSELGEYIRYVQDATGGIAAYGSQVSSLNEGDSIVISGILKDYKGLLEIDPVTDVSVISSGHELPAATVITPNQYSNAYEGMLISTKNVLFDKEGKFNSGQNYAFRAINENGQVRIADGSSPFVGTIIPQDTVNIQGILSEYSGQFQVLVRHTSDIKSLKCISFSSAPATSNISTTGLTLNWNTDSSGTTEAFIGNTNNFELPPIKESGETTSHSLNITGGSASMIYYVKPFSVRKGDTAFAGTSVYVTQSVSSGDMKVYFTQTVDHSVSSGTQAVYVNNAIADTLINYINRATSSIDMAIYNIDTYENSKIVTALNNAHSRGVDVRVIYDFNTLHTGIADLNPAIGKIASPEKDFNTGIGIMHNKFVVFDVNSDNNSFVWTGSTNMTTNQLTKDANNVVVIQDKSLALAYTLEFNEMFGSETTTPNQSQSKFGIEKADNTPHDFIINNKIVKLYFSPSDGTHTEILKTLKSATIDINAATMTFTKSDAAYTVVDMDEQGVTSKVIIDDPTQYDKIDILAGGLRENFKVCGESGMLHHKYVIVDQSSPTNAKVLTGSHNWTGSAQEQNDENTLIIHDQVIANEFYQEFTERFNNGAMIYPLCNPDSAEVNNDQPNVTIDILANDHFPTEYTLTVIQEAKNGVTYLSGNNQIYYQPNADFRNGNDSIWYKIKSNTYGFESLTWVKVSVDFQDNNSVKRINESLLKVYPNPSHGNLTVEFPGNYSGSLQLSVYNAIGKEVYNNIFHTNQDYYTIDLSTLTSGIYHVRLRDEAGNVYNNNVLLNK